MRSMVPFELYVARKGFCFSRTFRIFLPAFGSSVHWSMPRYRDAAANMSFASFSAATRPLSAAGGSKNDCQLSSSLPPGTRALSYVKPDAPHIGRGVFPFCVKGRLVQRGHDV